MRAAKHQGVNAMAQEGREVFFQDGAGDGSIGPTFLDQGHQQRTGAAEDLNVLPTREKAVAVSAAANRGAGSDNSDPSAPRFGQSRPNARQYDAEDRDGILLLQ